MRQHEVIAPECYLADNRQGYLVLLLQFVRPNKFICKPCKTQCLETFVRGASADNVYWNTVPEVIYPGFPKPAEERLQAKLEQLGINASNNWGLDLPYTQLSQHFEPSSQRITLFHEIWDAIANAANDLCAHAAEYREDVSIGDKLEFMAMSQFSIRDLIHERDPIDLILLIGRILSRSTNDNPDCICRLLSHLGVHHPDEIRSIDWPEFILSVARPFFGTFFPDIWSEAVNDDPARNPLSNRYPFPTMQTPLRFSPDVGWPSWIIQWQNKFAGAGGGQQAIAKPSGWWHSHPPGGMQQSEYSPASAREDALRLFLLTSFQHLYEEFKTTRQFEDCLLKGEGMMLQSELNIAAQQELVNEEFVANGGSELFCVSSDGHNMPVFTITEEERNLTLRHRMNPPIRRYWECEDDGSDPMMFPERWARLVQTPR